MTAERSYNPNDAAPGIDERGAARARGGKVERVPVVSSSLSSVGYDEARGELHVEFKSGRVVKYLAVPKHVARNLFAAPSVGKFHAAYVAKTYSFTPV